MVEAAGLGPVSPEGSNPSFPAEWEELIRKIVQEELQAYEDKKAEEEYWKQMEDDSLGF